MADEPTVLVADETSPLLGQPHVQPREPNNDGVGDGSCESPVGRNGIPSMASKMHIFLPAVGIGLYLCAMDQTLTMASYAKIGNDLNSLKNISWVTTSYYLTLTSFQPLSGKLSDIFGRKECLLSAHVIFAIGCLGCGLASNLTQLCVSRALTGIGGGTMNALVSVLISDIVPLRERGIWQGYMGIIFAAGMATGPPLGGLLADTIGWRWSFLAQVPLCCIGWVVLYFVLEVPRPSQDNLLAKIRRVDFLGAVILILGVGSLLVGLDSGPNVGWNHPTTVTALSLTPALFAVFMFVETKVATHPFAPGPLILHRSLFASYIASFCNMGSQVTTLFLAPLYFQAVLAYNATTSGTLLIPGVIAGVLATLTGGLLIKRNGKFYALTIWGHGLLAFSTLLLGLGFWSRVLLGEVGGLMLSMMGGGTGNAALLIALLANSAVADTAVVVACSYFFRSLGGSLSVGISSAILQQTLRGQLSFRLSDGNEARQIEEQVRESLDYIKELSPHVAAEVRMSYQLAIVWATIPSVVFAFVAFLVSFLIQEKRLQK